MDELSSSSSSDSPPSSPMAVEQPGTAGPWQVEMIIGPFHEWESAMEARDLWRQNSRGIISKKERGSNFIARSYPGVACWDKRK